jgi:transcriptional regulator with XRE-family HTH domain
MSKSIGERLRELRLDQGMSQQAFAKEIGMSRTGYDKFEIGAVQPRDIYLNALSDRFAVSVEWLKSGEGSMYASRKYTATEDRIARLVAEFKRTGEADQERFLDFAELFLLKGKSKMV